MENGLTKSKSKTINYIFPFILYNNIVFLSIDILDIFFNS